MIVQTRWHQDDLSGWVLASEPEEPERWHIVSLEAIKTDASPVVPATCTVEPDWRKSGEPLNSTRLSIKRLKSTKNKLGTYFWEALYQQRPSPLEGGMIKREWVQRYIEESGFDFIAQSWDTASKASELNCPWACTTWGVKGDRSYLLDVHTEKYEYPDGKRQVVMMAQRWKPLYVLIEDKSTGQSLLQELRRERSFAFTLVPIEPKGDKVTRMSIESAAFEGGRVYLPQLAPWLMTMNRYCLDILMFH